MNKRALIGKIILLALLAIFVVGATIYYTDGLKITTDKGVTATISYDPEQEGNGGIEIIELPPEFPIDEQPEEEPEETSQETNETNSTDPGLILEKNATINFTTISE